jgi:hypothetical protein
VLTMCGAPVGREEVRARVIPLRVGLATLRLLLYTYVCTVNGQERVAFLDRNEGYTSGGELATGRATGGWAHLKRADCRRTARFIIEVSLELEPGVAGGQN